MESDENIDDFSMLDSIAKLKQIVNPLKSTGFEVMLETQRKLEQIANPFKNTVIEDMLRSQNELKAITLPYDNSFMQVMAAQKELMQQLNEKLNPLQQFEIPHFYQPDNLSAIKKAIDLSEVRLLQSQIHNSHFVPSSLYDIGAFATFKHLELYKGYKIEEDDEQVYDPSQTQEPVSPIIRLDDTIKIQELIRSVYEDNKQLYKIHHFDFEDMIAELLRSKGLLVEVTKRTRDGGKDIIALHHTSGLGVNRYLVECKRYGEHRPVSVGLVRSFCYTVNSEKANKGIMFTSSYFSPDAYKLKEQEKNLLELKDGIEILAWISEYLKIKVY